MEIMNSADPRLRPLAELISRWPGNLTSSPDPRLLEDSLVLLPHLGEAHSLIDVGSGAGLPGLALAAVRPDLRVTLLESSSRKAAFLVHAAASIGLGNVEVVSARAEDAAHDPRLREAFDAATARALAPMPVLVELCLPFIRPGGRLLAMKAGAGEELAAAGPAIGLCGGSLVEVAAAPSGLRDRGQVVVVAKIAPTPARYPRRPGVPQRRPLGI